MSVDQTIDSEENEVDERGLTVGKGRATPGKRTRTGKETTTSEGGNFITRPIRGIFTFIGEVRDELNKVTWPTREETRYLSIIVVATTVATSIALGIISLIFTELFRFGLETPIILLVVLGVALGATVAFWRMGGRSNRSY